MHLDLAACRRGNSAIQLESSAAQFESSTVQFGTSAVQFQRSAVQFESSALLELKGLAEDTLYAQMCCTPGRSLKGCKCFSHAGCLSSRSLRRICFMHKRMSRSLRMRVRDERKHTQERTTRVKIFQKFSLTVLMGTCTMCVLQCCPHAFISIIMLYGSQVVYLTVFAQVTNMDANIIKQMPQRA